LRKDPSERYQSVREMIERLELRAEGIVPIECHITFTQRVVGEFMRWVHRRPLVFTVVLAVALAAALAGVAIRLAGR
jgi:hypothetical protein